MANVNVDKKLLLLKMNYFSGIAGYAPIFPFLSTIAKQRGYSAFIVGLIFMLHPILSLFLRPIVCAISDKYKCRRSVFVGCSIVIFILVGLLSIIPGTTSYEEMDDLKVIKTPLFWLFFSTISITNAIAMVKSALDDTICMDILGENKQDYGKQRLWGSVGWSLLGIVSGACVDWYSNGLDYKDYTPAYILSLLCLFSNILVVMKMEVVQNSNTDVVVSDIRKLFTESKLIAFLLWVIFFGFFMSFIWNYVFWYLEDLSDLYHPEMKPWMKTIQGIALITQCFFGEVPSYFLSSHILKNLEHMTVFSLMFVLFTAVFAAYSFITNPLWILPIEVLNGAVYGMTQSAAISYADIISPNGAEGTLQAVVGTAMSGIGAPFGSIVGGYMFKHIGSIASFKLLTVIAVVTCVSQITINYLINRFAKNENVKDVYRKAETEDNLNEIPKNQIQLQ